MANHDKPLAWVGSSRRDLRGFPEEVKDVVGFALRLAQRGEKSAIARPLRGFGGAAVLEILADHDGRAFRAAYAVRFRDVVYVLHAFEKKSRRGIRTPAKEIDAVRERLREAEARYRDWKQGRRTEP